MLRARCDTSTGNSPHCGGQLPALRAGYGGGVVTSTWVTAFIDLPAERYEAGVAFWRGVTGYGLSEARGEDGEFATLVPAVGDPFLRVQRTADGSAGLHLDLHHPDQAFRVLRSPGGLAYCEVSGDRGERPPPATWPGGHHSLVDQVCLDIPTAAYDEECAFWAERTGWPVLEIPARREFQALVRPADQPIRVLLQRVEDDRPRVTAHFDIGTDDRAAETARHEALGATVTRRHQWWTVLHDPTGAAYCITDRDPATGRLPQPAKD